MARRRLNTMDIYEMLRLMKLGKSNRAIASVMQINRKTVGKYRVWAEELGLLAGELPTPEALHRSWKYTGPIHSPLRMCPL